MVIARGLHRERVIERRKLLILKMKGKRSGQSLRAHLSREICIGCVENRDHWTPEHTALQFLKKQEVTF